MNYSKYRFSALLLTSVVLTLPAYSARADERLVLLTKSTLIHIEISFDRCVNLMKEADLESRLGRDYGASDKLPRCIKEAPASIKSSVDKLRLELARKPNAVAAFKDYVMTYRQLLVRLESPSTSVREVETYGAILDSKGEKVIAELEW